MSVALPASWWDRWGLLCAGVFALSLFWDIATANQALAGLWLWLLPQLHRYWPRLRRSFLFWWGVAFCVYLGGQALRSELYLPHTAPYLFSELEKFAKYGFPAALPLALLLGKYRQWRVRLPVMLLVGFVANAWGHSWHQASLPWWQRLWQDPFTRLSWDYTAPNAGLWLLLLAIGLGCWWGLELSSQGQRRHGKWALPLLGLLLTALLLTKSRSAWLLALALLPVVGMYISFTKLRLRWSWGGLVLVLALVLLVAHTPVVQKRWAQESQAVKQLLTGQWRAVDSLSIGSRLHMWRTGGKLLQQRPLWGWGLGSSETMLARTGIKAAYPQVHLPHFHNSFIEIGVQLGGVGLLFILGYGVYLLRALYRNSWAGTLPSWLGYSLGLGLLSMALHALANDPLGSQYGPLLLCFAGGLAASHVGAQDAFALPKGQQLALFTSFSGAGGVERMLVNLAQGLVAQGYSVDIVAVKAKSPALAELPEQVRLLPLGRGHYLTSIVPLARYLRRNQPQALLAAKERAGRAALLARWLATWRGRLVLRIGTTPAAALQQAPCWRRWAWQWPMRLSYPYYHAIVAVSGGVADNLAAWSGLPRQRIEVLPNPVVTPRIYAQARQPAPHAWLEDKTVPVIMGSGRLTRQKGFDVLLAAWAKLPQPRPRLIILGEGQKRQALAQQARQAGMADQLLLPGYVNNPYAWLARADLFVLASRWEGSPNVLTEALALGVPVVATDCPSGPREILEGGRVAPLVPVDDIPGLATAISRVLHQLPAADVLQQAACAYTQENSARAYARVLAGSEG